MVSHSIAGCGARVHSACAAPLCVMPVALESGLSLLRTRLLRRPSYAAALAVCIGLTSTIAGVAGTTVRWTVGGATPFPEPGYLYVVSRVTPFGASDTDYREYERWREATSAFVALGAIKTTESTLRVDDRRSTRVVVASVTPDWLGALALAPIAGRLLQDNDQDEGAPPTALLTAAAARAWFGRSQDALERHIRLSTSTSGEAVYRIVGVVPDETVVRHVPAFSVMTVARPGQRDGGAVYKVLGRLRPGVSPATAAGQINGVMAEAHRTGIGWPGEVQVHPLRDVESEPYLPGLRVVLLGATMAWVTGVLAASSLTRAWRRHLAKEVMVRRANGAGRRHLVTEELTTASALGLLSTVTCLGASTLLAGILEATALSGLSAHQLSGVELREAVLSVWALTGLCAAIAVHDVHRRCADSDAVGATTREQSGPFSALIPLCALLTASSAMLAVGATAVSDLVKAELAPLGFDVDDVVGVYVPLPGKVFEEPGRYRGLLMTLLDGARAVTGVEHAALARSLPGDRRDKGFFLPPDGTRVWVSHREVSPSYFELLRIPLREGRGLSADDGFEEILVNEALVTRYFAATQVVGMQLPTLSRLATDDSRVSLIPVPRRVIVGVVGDTWEGQRSMRARPTFYRNILTEEEPLPQIWVLVRTKSAAAPVLASLGEMVRAADPQLAAEPMVLADHMASLRADSRFFLGYVGAIAALCLMVSSGITVLTVMVLLNSRTREACIRMVLGGRTGRVVIALTWRLAAVSAVALLAGTLAGVRITHTLAWVLAEPDSPDRSAVCIAAVGLGLSVALALCAAAVRLRNVDLAGGLRDL